NGIAIDVNGRAYVTGDTASPELPITAGAVQKALAGGPHAYLSIIDPSLSGAASLVYSTLLGGEVEDFGRAVAVDAYGNAYITGNTFSAHFPVTANAFQKVNQQTFCSPTAQCS